MPIGVFIRTIEYREKMRRIALKNGFKPPSSKGKRMSEETKNKLRIQRIGIPRSKEVIKKMSKTFFKKGHKTWNKGKEHLREEKNPNWKCGKVGYIALHSWLKRYRGKANRCENKDCIYPKTDAQGRILLRPKIFEWANISHEYKRDLNDWKQLCASCHRKYDKQYRISNI